MNLLAKLILKDFRVSFLYFFIQKKMLAKFTNIKKYRAAYFTLKELLEIQNYISLYNMDVLFLEPRKIEGVPQRVLDKDYFLT
ncbi:P-loop NTPase family protein [Enterococcus durans]|uniref:hypothetical protein n=1 Tax=Enterococcus durans TaxID=53345 RepID=UPI00226C8D2F|nr:hypothetical protein [Enterococcus durans]